MAGVLVLAVAVGGWFAYGSHHHSKPAIAPVAQAPIKAAAPTVVGSSRIVRVDKPHVRLIPKDVDYTFDDLMTIPENAPPGPDFDSKFLVIKTPRRMTNDQGETVFLGELTNTSPDQVAVAPQVTLTLTRGGRKIDGADNHYPDLLPGAHIPIFFHYEGTTRSFDGMTFTWKPAKSYPVGAPRHPQLVTTITSQKREHTDASNTSERYGYSAIRVIGTITNKGDRAAKDVYVYVLLRDAKGLLSGFAHQTFHTTIEPGATVNFNYPAFIWSEPVANVEALALPTSGPSL